jgi:ketosteroid isomerase-like protein
MRLAALVTSSILATGAIVGCGAPSVDVSAETEAVRARSDALVTAEAAQDVEQALAYYADDAVVQPGGVPQVQGKKAIGDLYRQFGGFEGGQLKEFSSSRTHLQVSAAGDLAFEYGVNRMVLARPEEDLLDMGKYLAVWKKSGGEWYMAAISFTSDAPAPVPM